MDSEVVTLINKLSLDFTNSLKSNLTIFVEKNRENNEIVSNLKALLFKLPEYIELNEKYNILLKNHNELLDKYKLLQDNSKLDNISLVVKNIDSESKSQENNVKVVELNNLENNLVINTISKQEELSEEDSEGEETEEEEVKVNHIYIYTDGACRGNPGDGGWGVLIIELDNKVELFGGMKDVTNNQMELTAAIKALEYYKDNKNIKLYTDSKYVKDGITSWIKNWEKNNWNTTKNKPVKNIELWKKLVELNNKHNITWEWVKGHNDSEENEIADMLANKGIDSIYNEKPKEPIEEPIEEGEKETLKRNSKLETAKETKEEEEDEEEEDEEEEREEEDEGEEEEEDEEEEGEEEEEDEEEEGEEEIEVEDEVEEVEEIEVEDEVEEVEEVKVEEEGEEEEGEEEEDEEEEEEELELITIDGKDYYKNELNNNIYECLTNEDIGEYLGKLINGKIHNN